MAMLAFDEAGLPADDIVSCRQLVNHQCEGKLDCRQAATWITNHRGPLRADWCTGGTRAIYRRLAGLAAHWQAQVAHAAESG
jgi:hypothetical protein